MGDELGKLSSIVEEPVALPAEETAQASKEGSRTFRLWERVQILLASWVGYFTLQLIGRTLRWEIFGWENWESARRMGKGLIYTFWHREIFAATWFWRKRGIVVMTSRNFDGEYIARIIQKCGYGSARGSSSRGAVRGMAEMRRALRSVRDAAFTTDGPRGPRFVAKPGSVLLSKITGAPILCFHIALRRAYVFRKSWDLNQIPLPFSRAAIFIAPPLVVPSEADEGEQARRLREVQEALERLMRQGSEWNESKGKSKFEDRNSDAAR